MTTTVKRNGGVSISLSMVPLLADERLVRLRAEAIEKTKSAPTREERNKWSRFIVASDQEVNRRKAVAASAKDTVRTRSRPRTGPVRPYEGVDLAQRLSEAKEELFGDTSRREAKATAVRVAAEMRQHEN